jgi:hypothetical protein
MTTTTPLDEKKNPMTTQPAMTLSTDGTRSIDMNILKEALSRARMRSPRNEAFRSARRVAIQARRRQARELGDVSQLIIR